MTRRKTCDSCDSMIVEGQHGVNGKCLRCSIADGDTVTCGDCDGEADPQNARVLTRPNGPDAVLCLECRTAHPRSRQYRPSNIYQAARETTEVDQA